MMCTSIVSWVGLVRYMSSDGVLSTLQLSICFRINGGILDYLSDNRLLELSLFR